MCIEIDLSLHFLVFSSIRFWDLTGLKIPETYFNTHNFLKNYQIVVWNGIFFII